MRPFNENERRIIKKLSELPPGELEDCRNFLQNNFFTEDNKFALIVKHDSKDLLFYLDKTLFKDKVERKKKCYELFELINLLDYLIKMRYITVVKPAKNKDNFNILYSNIQYQHEEKNLDKIKLNDEGDYIIPQSPAVIYNTFDEPKLEAILLNEYYEYIYNNIFGLIFLSEELRDLVKEKFKTKEDRKHIQILRVSWIAIIIALILGILGIL